MIVVHSMIETISIELQLLAFKNYLMTNTPMEYMYLLLVMFVVGVEARSVLMQSGLPHPILAQVW